MVTTGAVVTGNPLLFAVSASGTSDTFEYLNGNPNPDPTKAAEAYTKGFFFGFLCGYFGASC
jgi:hypothetical protein